MCRECTHVVHSLHFVCRCTFAIDKAIVNEPRLWFHPLHNDKSTSISGADLIKFLQNTGIMGCYAISKANMLSVFSLARD